MSKTRVALTKSQKKYLKNHLKEKTLGEIASHLEVPIEDLTWYLEKRWGKEKFQKFSAKREQNPFNFRTWWRQNRLKLGLLVFLVTAAYINSLGNDFVADDVGAIANNEDINQAGYIFSNRLRFLRPLIYSVVNQMSGLRPAFYRLTNILFHLGTVLTLYLLLYLLINPTAALLTAVLTAVHPIMTEAVTWISGGSHAQYSFFGLSSLLAYLLATREKKYYPLSLIFLLLALLSSEKAVVLPIIFLAFEMANKNLTKNWKKLIIPLMMSGFLITISTRAIAPRMETLQTHFYQKPSTLNPLTQIPIAITSYLELIFWPKNLTLYHSEMIFTQTEYLIRLGIFLAFLGSIVYTYRRQRQVFFWLSFFIISLLPTLTPFGISWIVAERYVYLGATGIFVVVALVFNQLWKNEKLRPGVRILFSLIILALLTRTIVRNVDWKDQDTLWLATAKTSPSSSQNHNNLGDYYGRQGDFEKAIEEFKRAIELNPNYAGAYHNLANTYRQLGKTDWAIENYQKAAELNPNLWQSHQNLAVSYFDRGQLDLAEENMKKAIEVNPENANLYLNLGIVYLRMEDKPRAEEAFQKARELDPQIQTPPTQP